MGWVRQYGAWRVKFVGAAIGVVRLGMVWSGVLWSGRGRSGEVRHGTVNSVEEIAIEAGFGRGRSG